MLRIKELCDLKGITQKTLAERAGITQAGLCRLIESDQSNTKTLEKLAKALDVHVVDLFERKEDFVAFVYCDGELKKFDTRSDLKEYSKDL